MTTMSLPAPWRLALTERRRLAAPRLWPLLAGVLAIDLGVVLVALLDADPRDPLRHFHEAGLVTASSAVYLAVAGALAGVCWWLSAGRLRERVLWGLTAAASFLLALDEQVEFHERLGYRLQALYGDPGSLRNWNDLVVLAYGVLALAFVARYGAAFLRYPRVLELLAAGFVAYGFHTGIDTLSRHPEATMVVEEACKLASTSLIALAFLMAFAGLLESRRAGPETADRPAG